jgi:hypothetical protein
MTATIIEARCKNCKISHITVSLGLIVYANQDPSIAWDFG